MPIYTKKGDRGQTGLFDGTRVTKDDTRIEAIGAVDELNTQLGLVIAQIKDKRYGMKEKKKENGKQKLEIIESLEQIQKDLFGIGATLAGYTTKGLGVRGKGLEEQVREMEGEIDRRWKEMPELSNFILPGGSLAGAQLHLARAVCRRCERSVVTYVSTVNTEPSSTLNSVMKYLNRLGDYLFALARWMNWKNGIKEIIWNTTR